MILTEVILRLRAECPLFSRRVGGTAKFSAVSEMDAEAYPLPAAFVMPITTEGAPRTNEDNAYTDMVERVAVVVCVDNTLKASSGWGASASQQLQLIENELFDALVGWRPKLIGAPDMQMVLDQEAALLCATHQEWLNKDVLPVSNLGTYSFVASGHLFMTAARLWHQFEYEIRYPKDRSEEKREEAGLGPSIKELYEIYGGWAPEIGIQHIDDYDLLVKVDKEVSDVSGG
ncbi:hypothetical protein H10PHJ05_39 [Aeromonas phage HJ05]|nr:hypothetical protein H10PHJ05_39 [Aeromonas phage HJ05]